MGLLQRAMLAWRCHTEGNDSREQITGFFYNWELAYTDEDLEAKESEFCTHEMSYVIFIGKFTARYPSRVEINHPLTTFLECERLSQSRYQE